MYNSMPRHKNLYLHNVVLLLIMILLSQAAPCYALSSANIPLDSPLYGYL